MLYTKFVVAILLLSSLYAGVVERGNSNSLVLGSVKVFKTGALNAKLGLTIVSISKFAIRAVSEILPDCGSSTSGRVLDVDP